MNGSDGGYGEIEADFLYCFVRCLRPASIVQVGCGVSTAVCLLASRDEGYNPRIICIEPYPTVFLRNAHESGGVTLIRKKLQDLTLECPKWVGKGDLFFVDSSHTLGPAGEVSQIILEILPRLLPGAYVHFHDITFPYDYDPHVLSSGLFFSARDHTPVRISVYERTIQRSDITVTAASFAKIRTGKVFPAHETGRVRRRHYA